MRGNPTGSHWSMGSFASAAGTCLTPGPEGLWALSVSRPKGVYCRGRIMCDSSGRPPSTPCPRGASSAGCSNAPLGWRPPSSSAASQIPEMSRRGAGADFFPAYAGLIGGMLFHLSGLACSTAALGAAVCAPSTGESVQSCKQGNYGDHQAPGHIRKASGKFHPTPCESSRV